MTIEPSSAKAAWAARLTLAGLLLLAAVLRFTGLAWGLRHIPHIDERYFVESTAEMLAAGDFDHRYYPYPGLFFYLLAPVLAWLDPDRRTGPEGYLAARGLVALFGVASVAIVYRLGLLVADRRAGLLAAGLMAVSPVAVHTAHMVRPDVVLGAFALGALLVFYGTGTGLRGDIASGAALGVVNAVKFSGVLLIPTWLLLRPRSRALLAGSVACVVAFVCLTPYSVLHFGDFVGGARAQVEKNMAPDPGALGPTYWQMVGLYGRVWVRAVGLAGALLAAAGVVLVARRWRTWLPLIAYPLTTLLVISLSVSKYDRHTLASLGVVALLAGVTVSALSRRFPVAGLLVALACLVPPLLVTAGHVRYLSRPGTRDRILDYVQGSLPTGARVLTSIEDLGLDRGTYEVLVVPRLNVPRVLQALEMDYLITTQFDEEEATAAVPVVHAETPEDPVGEPLISLRQVPPEARPPYRPVALPEARVTASENEALANAIDDGSLETWWETSGETPGQWIRVDFPASHRLARVEILKGGPRRGSARELVLEVSLDGASWDAVSYLPARPAEAALVSVGSRPPSHVMVFDAVEARSLRIRQAGPKPWKWRVAEVRLDELP